MCKSLAIAWLLHVVLPLVVLGIDSPAQLTPAQVKVIADARVASAIASKSAEEELLNAFSSEAFKLELSLEGRGRGQRLASLLPAELLAAVKGSLDNLEWTMNFGLDAESQKLHPGDSAMGTQTVEEFGGRFPTMWELKTAKSPLAANLSVNEWGILEAAEQGLYHQSAFVSFAEPTLTEATQRPAYLAGNMRRLDIGVQRYGAIAAVVRGDVVRERVVILGSDSGGWETGCNKSVTPVQNQSWIEKMLEKEALRCEPVHTTPLGVAEQHLHSFLANSRTFGKVGGHLARLVYQLLEDDADVRPLEGNMYTEGGLLGNYTVGDNKLFVASFPGLFGTPQGLALRSFCQKYGVPLAWGLGSGRTWPEEEARQLSWAPLEPFEFWSAGSARLLDPVSGWPFTNSSAGGGSSSKEAWSKVWDDIEAARQRGSSRGDQEGRDLNQDAFKSWWRSLAAVDPPVKPLQSGDCASADLCFGTFHTTGPGAPRDCACRVLPAAKAAKTVSGKQTPVIV